VNGKKVRVLREARSLTQEKLAEDIGIPQSNLSAVEAGKRGLSIAALRRLAKALGTTIDDLLTEEVPLSDPVVEAGVTA